MPYPDTDVFVRDWLRTQLGPDVTVRVELPMDVGASAPLVCVETYAGNDPTLTVDDANIDFDVFCEGRSATTTLAEKVRDLLRRRFPGFSSGGVTVLDTQVTKPSKRPWDESNIRRFGMNGTVRTKSVL